MKKKSKSSFLKNKLAELKSISPVKWLVVFGAMIIIFIIIIFSRYKVQKVMFWQGKVNQHWDIKLGEWATDPDGISGAEVDKLEYCRKFYLKTVRVVPDKEVFFDNWRNVGNQGKYSSVKTSYLCKQK